jgi:ubiquinone/menaquinone biosynthesis C-methylase UbiE
MDELPQAPEKFLRRQRQKRHLAAVWAKLAGLQPGMSVLDVGCGPGILAAEYAAIVAPGMVYALEPRYALHQALPNLLHLRQDAASVILPSAPDVIFLTDTLHHLADRPAALRRLRAVCGKGTKLLVAEFDPAGPGLFGPTPAERMPRGVLVDLLTGAGFALGWVDDTVDERYAALATPAWTPA